MGRIYTHDEAQVRAASELPFWRVEDGCLQRVYRTSGWKASLMVVNTVGHLAEAAWHHPEVCLSYYAVTIKLLTHKVNGITDRDFALAAKIEEVVAWQPAKGRSPLRGTPNDEGRFKYLDYDELPRSM